MTSSTSNSDPGEPVWTRVWAVALLLTLIVVGGWELLMRGAGLGPAYVDNKVLWADTRHRLNSQGEDAIVLLGASRMQRAVDTHTMRDFFDRPVFQLAVEGTSYLPALENLAADPRIRGTVVVSIAPAFTYNKNLSQLDTGVQSIYLDYYNSQSLARRIEQRLTLFLQGYIGFRGPDARLSRVVPHLLEQGTLPAPDHETTFRDRVVHVNYDAMPAKQTDEVVAGHYLDIVIPYTPEEFEPVIAYNAAIVRQLRSKGVDVYFVRLPSAGAVKVIEDGFFPREKFWDVLEQNVDATFIHFADHPELEGYLHADGSHVDSTHIVTFTRLLNGVLASNGLAKRPQQDP